MSIDIEIKRPSKDQKNISMFWVVSDCGDYVKISFKGNLLNFHVNDIPTLIKNLETVAKAVKDDQ